MEGVFRGEFSGCPENDARHMQPILSNFDKRKINQSRWIWNNIKIKNFSYRGVFKFEVFKIKSCFSQFIPQV